MVASLLLVHDIIEGGYTAAFISQPAISLCQFGGVIQGFDAKGPLLSANMKVGNGWCVLADVARLLGGGGL